MKIVLSFMLFGHELKVPLSKFFLHCLHKDHVRLQLNRAKPCILTSDVCPEIFGRVPLNLWSGRFSIFRLVSNVKSSGMVPDIRIYQDIRSEGLQGQPLSWLSVILTLTGSGEVRAAKKPTGIVPISPVCSIVYSTYLDRYTADQHTVLLEYD